MKLKFSKFIYKNWKKKKKKKRLNDEYKELFEIGFFDFKGMKFPLTGNYEDYGTFKEILNEIVSEKY